MTQGYFLKIENISYNKEPVLFFPKLGKMAN